MWALLVSMFRQAQLLVEIVMPIWHDSWPNSWQFNPHYVPNPSRNSRWLWTKWNETLPSTKFNMVGNNHSTKYIIRVVMWIVSLKKVFHSIFLEYKLLDLYFFFWTYLWAVSCFPTASYNQSNGDSQQCHPGEENWLWGVWRSDGGLAEMLRHVRWAVTHHFQCGALSDTVMYRTWLYLIGQRCVAPW